MNTKLEECLEQFKGVTLTLITNLEDDNIDILDSLFEARQVVIDNMSKLNYSQEEFTTLCDNMGVVKLNETLSLLMQGKRDVAKLQLETYRKTKAASLSYNKSQPSDSMFISKKY